MTSVCVVRQPPVRVCFEATAALNGPQPSQRTRGTRSAGLTWVGPEGTLVPHVAVAGTEGRWLHSVVYGPPHRQPAIKRQQKIGDRAKSEESDGALRSRCICNPIRSCSPIPLCGPRRLWESMMPGLSECPAGLRAD